MSHAESDDLTNNAKMPKWVPRAILLFWVGFIATLVVRELFHQLTNFFILLLISLFFALAIEPAVNRLAARGLVADLERGAEAVADGALQRGDDAVVAEWFRQRPHNSAEKVAAWNELAPNIGKPGFPMHRGYSWMLRQLYGGIPPEVAEHEELMAMLLPSLAWAVHCVRPRDGRGALSQLPPWLARTTALLLGPGLLLWVGWLSPTYGPAAMQMAMALLGGLAALQALFLWWRRPALQPAWFTP